MLDGRLSKLLSECRCLLGQALKGSMQAAPTPGRAKPSPSPFVLLPKSSGCCHALGVWMGTSSVHSRGTEKPAFKVSVALADPQQGATGGNGSSWRAPAWYRSPEPGDVVKSIQEKNPSDALGIGAVPRGTGWRERGKGTHLPHSCVHGCRCWLAGRMLPVPRQSLISSLVSLIKVIGVELRPHLPSFTRSGRC